MAKDNVARLLELKEEIEVAKLDKAKLEGALKQNLQRLKDEFGVNSVEKAKIEANKMRKKLNDLKDEIDEAVEKLEKEYDW